MSQSWATSGGTPAPAGQKAHEIEFEIVGNETQFLKVVLDPQEACIAEAGAFMFKDPGIRMETIFGDGSNQSSGLWGSLLGAGKRLLTGESLFMTAFGNGSNQRQTVAFAAPYPGRILPMDLRQLGGTLLCQKDAFLCAARGVSVGIAFQRKLGAGFFGGEGFILQKLEGDGLAFVHAGGAIEERMLASGETVHLDTGCLVAMDATVNYDIEFIGGIKNSLFGGEGLFFAVLRGPGRVWMQSLPLARLANRILAGTASRTGQGSALGGLGSVMMGGDE